MGKGKKKLKINKEEIAEDWCFVCKDGGDVRICDYKQCLKSYHPDCVEKDDSFLDSESHFNCPWHTCSHCSRCSVFHCYTCPYSICRHCILTDAEFTRVKGENGFCHTCLKLVLLVEEGKDYDSDGEKVDFTDRNSVECLYMEYYMIIKKEKGFELTDINAARDKMKIKKDIQSGYSSEEFYESDEDQVSDYDDCTESQKKRRKTQKGKKSKRQSFSQTHLKSSKMEFVGWGSKPLIEFLSSIGKSTAEKLSQRDVTSIVNEYIKEKKLFDPQRRKLINCDAKLQCVFKRKRINKFRVSDLLEPHFAENEDESEEDKQGSDSNNRNLGISESKSKRKHNLEKKCQKKELGNGVSHTGFVSIVVENIKLVYLKRSLIYELVKERESFEEKVIGSFVRIKTDPYDCSTRNSHQLMQVKGVKPASEGESTGEIVLLFPTMYRESRISLLSDDNFSEAECEELKQKMVAGLLERPTVVELEQKAKVLHEDITKHWISKELALLKKRIDQANEKGWRRELFEYLEKRNKLQTPSEQARLLDTVPTVIPETISDSKSSSDDKNADVESDEDSPKSVADGKTHHGHTSPSEKQTSDTDTRNIHSNEEKDKKPESNGYEEEAQLISQQRMKSQEPSSTNEVIDLVSDGEDEANEKFDDVESSKWCILGPNGERHKCSLFVLKRWSELTPYSFEFKIWREDEEEEDAISLPEAIRIAFPK